MRVAAQDQYILGISAFFHDSAAALVKNGSIIAAAQEERFTRRKFDRSFPLNSIDYCLQAASITPSALSSVAYFEDPQQKLDRIIAMSADGGPSARSAFRRPHIFPGPAEEVRGQLRYDGPIKSYRHHESHAAYSFGVSGFGDAAVITLDTIGEWESAAIWAADGNELRQIDRIFFPNSLGAFYTAITTFLGFAAASDEYKVMGLAPYGAPEKVKALSHFLSINENGVFEVDPLYLAFNAGGASNHLETLLNMPPREAGAPLLQCHADLARSAQTLVEEAMLGFAKRARRISGSQRLCMGGGVALNCVANTVVRREAGFEEVFVPPGAGDAGSAIGAGLLEAWASQGAHNIAADGFSADLGPSYTSTQVRRELEMMKFPFLTLSAEELTHCVAKLLREGSVIGWFQGAMEFGPRALGNRSILADPRRVDMRDKVNRVIKKRESFRPFAPICLASRAPRYFEVEGPDKYMTFVVRAKVPESMPAVVHVDGTARLQIVPDDSQSAIARLLRDFETQTGFGVLLNTSFNASGEPIVCSPFDALLSFRETNLDFLIMENHLIKRDACSRDLLCPDSRQFIEYSRERRPYLSDTYAFS